MASTSAREIARQIALQCRHAVGTRSPLLLLVFYQHEGEKLEVLAELYRELQEEDLPYEQLDPAHRPDQGAGRLYDSIATTSQDGVAIIPAMPRCEDTAGLDSAFLEYLNLNRDRIARDHLRFVLFLHSEEAEQFIREAGDLWDFRHHTYWLERSPKPRGAELWDDLERDSVELSLPAAEVQELMAHLARVRDLVENTAVPEEKAALLLDLSQWLQRRRASGLAAEVAMEGLGQCPEESAVLRCKLENALGYALLEAARLPEALPHLERSLSIASDIGEHAGTVANLSSIAQIYRRWGRYNEALVHLKNALGAARKLRNHRMEATLLNDIGVLHKARGDHKQALKFFEKALKTARLENDLEVEALVLNNMAETQHELSQDEAALKSLQRSLALRIEIGDRRGEAAALGSIAVRYRQLGRHEEALAGLQRALSISQELDDLFTEAAILNNLGAWHLSLDRFEEALPFLRRSIEVARAVGDRRGEAISLTNLGNVYGSLGRHEESWRALEQGLSIFRDIGDVVNEAKVARTLAHEWARQGDLGKALPFACRTVEIDQSLGSPEIEEDRELLRHLKRRVSRSLQPSTVSSPRR